MIRSPGHDQFACSDNELGTSVGPAQGRAGFEDWVILRGPGGRLARRQEMVSRSPRATERPARAIIAALSGSRQCVAC